MIYPAREQLNLYECYYNNPVLLEIIHSSRRRVIGLMAAK